VVGLALPALGSAESGYVLQRGAGPFVALWLLVFVIPFFIYVPDGSPAGGAWREAARQVFSKDGKLNPLAAATGVVGYFKGLYRQFPETMKYLGEKGIMSAGLDGASMGPLPDLAVATHQAGGAFGMIWIECGTNFKALPPTGAFYALLPAKHAGGSGGEARVLAITEPKLAAQLIAAARAKRVTDVSVTLENNLPVTWQGHGPGEEAQRYLAEPLNQ
jgi:hypothetical protein